MTLGEARRALLDAHHRRRPRHARSRRCSSRPRPASSSPRPRASSSLGHNLLAQVGGRPRATLIAAGMLFAIGLLPGHAELPVLRARDRAAASPWRATRARARARPSSAPRDAERARGAAAAAAATATETLATRRVELLAGRPHRARDRLPPDPARAGQERQRASSTTSRSCAGASRRARASCCRRCASRTTSASRRTRYRILLGGQEVARGELEPGAVPGDGRRRARPASSSGKATTDPAFGLPAWWIAEAQRDEAEIARLHGRSIRRACSSRTSPRCCAASIDEILSRDDVKELVENVQEDLAGGRRGADPRRSSATARCSASCATCCARACSIRNMPAILEVLADNAGKTKDPEALTELVRQRLGRALCEMHADGERHAARGDARSARSSRASPPRSAATQDPEAAPVSPA